MIEIRPLRDATVDAVGAAGSVLLMAGRDEEVG